MLLLNPARLAAPVGAASAFDAARKAVVSLTGYVVVDLLMAVSLALPTLSGYRAICLGLGEVYAALFAVQMHRR